jgi:hypothetical protein
MTKDTVPEIPIACALSAGQSAEREGAWRKLLGTSPQARERVPGGLRLVVRPGAGPELNALVDLERNCCPWIAFIVSGESVTMTAQGRGEEVLVEMFSLTGPASTADRSIPRT